VNGLNARLDQQQQWDEAVF